jgi:hypothetical protein
VFFLIFFRLLIFAFFIFLIYKALKYLFSSRRKLELAHEQKKFYLHDDHVNVRKNLLLTYNGTMFEGEKYLGTTENSFAVVSIFIWPKSSYSLQGFKREDFKIIENSLKLQYPDAKIDWKSPIKEFLHAEIEQEN